MGICYIVGAVPFTGRFRPQTGDLVIAADGGWERLKEKGIRPDVIVGDFDSSAPPAAAEAEKIIRVPCKKDDTDSALAAKEGIRRGYENFVFYGCLGGALDHTFANIQLLYGLMKQGFRGCLAGDGVTAVVLTGGKTAHFDRLSGRVSVFSLTGVSRGVTLAGLEYPLRDAVLTSDTPLGVSNRGLGGPASVSVGEGALLLLLYT